MRKPGITFRILAVEKSRFLLRLLTKKAIWGAVALALVFSFLPLEFNYQLKAISYKLSHAAANYQINYQGKLTDASDDAVTDGDYDIVFNLYTAATGGTAIWTESHTAGSDVTVTNGLFSVMLGSITSLSTVNFNQTLYLGVTIEADDEMTPRKTLGAVPAAFQADKLDGLDSTDFLSTSTAEAPKLWSLTGLGNIGSSTATTTILGNLATAGVTIINNILSVYDHITAPYFIATSTTASVLPYASTTAITTSGTASTTDLIVSGTATIGSLTGILEASTGLVSTFTTSSANPLYFNGTTIAPTSTPTFATFHATSTSASSTAGVIVLSKIVTSATSTGINGFDITAGCFAINGVCVGGSDNGSVSSGLAGQLAYYASDGTTVSGTTTGNITAGRFTATTSVASILPYASSTGLTVSGSADIARLAIGTNIASGLLDIKNTDTPANDVFRIIRNSDTNLLFKVREAAAGHGLITIYNGATAGVELNANGVSYLNGGNVGIGSTSPSAKLTIGGGNLHIGGFITSTSTAASTLPYASSTGLTVSGSTYLATTEGNVGVGTTTPVSLLNLNKVSAGGDYLSLTAGNVSNVFSTIASNGTTFLDVSQKLDGSGGVRFTSYGESSYGMQFRALTDSGGGESNPSFDFVGAVDDGAGGLQAVGGTNRVFTVSNNSNRLLDIQADGNVGIGSTSPSAKLTIGGGNLHIGGFITSTSTASSTFLGPLVATKLDTSATSTGTQGFDITAGCFAINGVCVGGNDNGTVASGLAGQLAYYAADGTTVSGTTTGVITGGTFVATTSVASILPYASSTGLTVSGSAYLATAGGKVGIGTTTPAGKLHIHSPTTVAEEMIRLSDATGNAAVNKYINWYSLNGGTNNFDFARIGAGYGVGLTNSFMAFSVADSAKTLQERMRIGVSGQVGIGTTSPSANYKLSIAGGDVHIGGAITSTSTTASVLPYASSTGLTVSGSTYLATAGGNVGIGTTTPSAALGIQGDIFLAGRLVSTSSTATSTFAAPVSLTKIVTSATSTGTNGFDISAGCFAIRGTCVSGGSGSGTVESGTAGYGAFYASAGTTLSPTSTLQFTNYMGRGALLIGASSSVSDYDITGQLHIVGGIDGAFSYDGYPVYPEDTDTKSIGLSINAYQAYNVSYGETMVDFVSHGFDNSPDGFLKSGFRFLTESSADPGFGPVEALLIDYNGNIRVAGDAVITGGNINDNLNVYLSSGTAGGAGSTAVIAAGGDTDVTNGGAGGTVSLAVGGNSTYEAIIGGDGGRGGTVNIANGGTASDSNESGGNGGVVNLVKGGVANTYGNDGVVNIGNSAGNSNASLHVYGSTTISGFVGVGTTTQITYDSLLSALTVRASAGNHGGLVFEADSNKAANIVFAHGGDSYWHISSRGEISAAQSGQLRIGRSSGSGYSHVMSFLQNGSVGIGSSKADSSNPVNALLDIATTSTTTTGYIVRIENSSTSAMTRALQIRMGVAHASRTTNTRFIDFADTTDAIRGSIQGGASVVAYSTNATDFAEYMRVSPRAGARPAPGDIVAIDPAGDEEVLLATNATTSAVMGVVSTAPGFIGGGPVCDLYDVDCNQNYEENHILIGMTGRVPVKVNVEGGTIKPGDKIGVSSTPGVGMKAAPGSLSVGTALQSFDSSGTGTIIMFIDLSYSRLSQAISSDGLSEGYWSLDETTGELKPFAALDLGGKNIKNVGAIVSASGNWSISADGVLVTKEVRTEKLCIGSVCLNENDLRSLLQMAGIGITEVITGGGDDNDDNNDDNGTTTDDTTATTTLPLDEDEAGTSTPSEEADVEAESPIEDLPAEEPPVEEPDPEPESAPEPEPESAPEEPADPPAEGL